MTSCAAQADVSLIRSAVCLEGLCFAPCGLERSFAVWVPGSLSTTEAWQWAVCLTRTLRQRSTSCSPYSDAANKHVLVLMLQQRWDHLWLLVEFLAKALSETWYNGAVVAGVRNRHALLLLFYCGREGAQVSAEALQVSALGNIYSVTRWTKAWSAGPFLALSQLLLHCFRNQHRQACRGRDPSQFCLSFTIFPPMPNILFCRLPMTAVSCRWRTS